MPFTYEYPRPSVTVDCAIFAVENNNTYILLIQRGKYPFKGKWALPGGFVDMDEELIDAAKRELKEETTLEISKLEQLGTYGRVGRDPRGRTISVVYYGMSVGRAFVKGQDDAADAKWFLIDELPEFAFDHQEIVHFASSKFRDEFLIS